MTIKLNVRAQLLSGQIRLDRTSDPWMLSLLSYSGGRSSIDNIVEEHSARSNVSSVVTSHEMLNVYLLTLF